MSNIKTTGALMVSGKPAAPDVSGTRAAGVDRSALKADGPKLNGNGVFKTNGR